MALKLSKEEKKKIAMGITLFVVFVVSYFMFLVSPAKAAKIKAEKDLKLLTPKIEAAKKQIAKVEAMEVDSPKIKLLMDQINLMIPSGPPVAWFPPKLEEILKSCGIEKPSIVASTEWPDKEVKDYKRLNWDIEIARITFHDLCKTLQTLENQEPLFEIMNITVESNNADPEFMKANFTIRNLVRKL